MKSIAWFVVGVALGTVFARQFGKTEQGRHLFAGIDRKARDFGQAVTDGYRSREAELREAIAVTGDGTRSEAV